MFVLLAELLAVNLVKMAWLDGTDGVIINLIP
jgi:hypothetical protein